MKAKEYYEKAFILDDFVEDDEQGYLSICFKIF